MSGGHLIHRNLLIEFLMVQLYISQGEEYIFLNLVFSLLGRFYFVISYGVVHLKVNDFIHSRWKKCNNDCIGGGLRRKGCHNKQRKFSQGICQGQVQVYRH